MKRSINVLSILVLICAAVMFYYLFRAANTASASVAFAGFPINQPRTIRFEVNKEALEDKSQRERLDQARDWLLYAVVSESGKSVKELGEMLYDLPATRSGYMHHVGNFEYGETRSRFIGDGQVVALVPADNSAERTDQLAHIADEHRKNTGEIPKSILVFDYKLNLDGQQNISSGEITRREAISGDRLFTAAAGYFENTINSLDDLNNFMRQVDDLVFADRNGEVLKLGGRKILGRPYRGIGVEDVAAIWQSGNKLKGQPHGSGFSLDPAYRFDKIRHFFDTTLVPIYEQFSAYNSLYPEQSLRPIWPYTAPLRRSPSVTVSEVREGLDACKIEPLFTWFDEQREANPEMMNLIDMMLTRGLPRSSPEETITLEDLITYGFGFQQARYDGDLQGTQVGMVLFYTDLVAKLWGFDYKSSTPREISDFRSGVAINKTQPSIFNKQMKDMPYSRLWFGPDTKGYQATDGNRRLAFARKATRLFAKSAKNARLQNEVEANPATAAFINWWDDHFEEVARYEPQYERLNQIMKWSLLISWLNQTGQGNQLGFLSNPDMVKRNYRFPDWVKQQKDLRFNKWSQDMFIPNTKCSTTEALPLLSSENFAAPGEKIAKHFLIGGVSLGEEELFAGRTLLSAETKVPSLAVRSTLDLSPMKSSEEALELMEGTAYKFESVAENRLSVTAVPRHEAMLRDGYGDLVSSPFKHVLADEGGGALNVATKYGETEVGKLAISPTENGFTIGWYSRDLELGQSVARQLSVATAPEKFLAENPLVETAIKLQGDEGYLVKLSGSERWTRLSFQAKPSANIEAGWEARFADTVSTSKPVDVAWWDQSKVAEQLGGDDYLMVARNQKSGAKLLEVTSDPPVAASERVTIMNGEQKIEALVDPRSESIYVKYADLSEALQRDPGEFQRVLSRIEITEDGVLRLPGANPYDTALGQQLGARSYTSLAKQLSESPANFKASLENNFKGALTNTDNLLASRNYDIVDSQLDELIEFYGPRQELMIRKGVAQIGKGQIGSAAETLDETIASLPSSERTIFFDEINQRLRTSAEEFNLLQLADDGKSFTGHCRIPSLAQGSKISPEAIQYKSATIYIEDSPRLNNLDWNVNVEASLNEVVSGDFGEVIKLPRGNISKFRPTEIYAEDVGKTFHAVQQTTTQYNLRIPLPTGLGTQCQNGEQDRDCGDVYLVVDRSRR